MTKTFTPVSGAARERGVCRGRRRQLVPAEASGRLARPFVGLRRRMAEPVDSLHLRFAVAAHVVVGRQFGDELTDAARGSGRRSAVSPARTRASTSSRVGWLFTGGSVTLRSGSEASERCRLDALRHGAPLGDELDRDAVRRHARVPAARLRDHSVLRGHGALLGVHVRARAQLQDRAARPEARAARGRGHLLQPDLLRLLGRQDLGGDRHPLPRRDADLHRHPRGRLRARADGPWVLARDGRLAGRRRVRRYRFGRLLGEARRRRPRSARPL